jgi:hypothetical protein
MTMRRDARVHVYEAAGQFRTLQIPYAVPEVCAADPEVLKIRALADGAIVFATSDWVWAEADYWPATDHAGDSLGDGGPIAVRFCVPATGEEYGVWCDGGIVSSDVHGRPCVLDAVTGGPLCLFRAPRDVLGSSKELETTGR